MDEGLLNKKLEWAEQSAGFKTRPRKSCFIHEFTKTPPEIVCPHFFVLSHANGCPFACDYCYLQLTFRYLKRPTVFSNRQDLLRDVHCFLTREKSSVLSAGELSDALAYDPHTRLSRDLVPLFARQDKHKLLLLTKSTNVENLLDLPGRRNTIVSFSLNAPEVAARFEHKAPASFERIEAASKCQAAGYEVRLRIDPIVPLDGWRELYQPLIDEIQAKLVTESMRFTLGSIRFFRPLPNYAQSRGRDCSVFAVAKSCDGADRRLRVEPALRVEVYSWFREQLPPTSTVALCKETVDLWKELGWAHTNPKCNCAL